MKGRRRVRRTCVIAGILGVVLWAGAITVRTQSGAPGGVSGAALWVKADMGLAVNGSNHVEQWLDQSGSANITTELRAAHPAHTNAIVPSAAILRVPNSINFNPAVDFNGASGQSLKGNASTEWDTGPLSIFAVSIVEGASSGPNVSAVWDSLANWTGSDSTAAGAGLVVTQTGANYAIDSSGSILALTTSAINQPRVVRALYPTATNALGGTTWLDGVQEATATARSTSVTTLFELGGRTAGTAPLDGRIFNGKIAEVVVYKSALTATNANKVESYLALKHGITLRQTPSVMNYLDSGAAVVWDATANGIYRNNIAGIGRDEASTLNQKQSRSVNLPSSGNLVTIGLGTIAADNASNGSSFTADRSFLVWGDDGASVAITVPVVPPGGAPAMRMARTWRTQETGTIGTVKVGVPTSTSSGTLYLVASSDATFNAGDMWVPMTPFTPDGIATYLAADSDFASGQYFTFATAPPLDLGDAPSSYGTLLANDGARHSVPGYDAGANTAPLMLGASIDVETDGAASADATGDDAAGVDDENGVTFPSLVAGLVANLSVTIANTGPPARLSGWADWNNNGTFEAGEQIVPDLTVVAGPNTVSIAVPATAGGLTKARFRVSTQTGLGSTGAAPDGEVEDYQVVVTSQADLAITKAGNQATYVPGAPIGYTIVVTNAGPSQAAGVIVSDIVPAAIGGVTTSCAATGAASCGANASSGNNISFTGASLAPGVANQLTITIVGTVAPLTTGDLVNTATVASAMTDPVSTNNTSTVQTAVVPQADVRLTKIVDNPAPNVGTTVTFTVTATNAGPNDATGLIVADQLPEGLRLVSAAPSVGTFDAATRLWSVGTLTAGTSEVLLVTADVLQSGTRANVATVAVQNETDPDTSNNSAGAAVNAPSAADLRVTKQADVASAAVGSAVTFTVTLTNAGPDEASAVQVLDALPPGLGFLNATPSVGTFDPATGLWAIDAIATGAAATLQLSATVLATGTSTNIAQVVSSGVYDPSPANDAGGASVNGLATDVQVIKTADRPQGVVGETIAFTVIASNLGPNHATGLLLEDRLPPGLQFLSASATHGSYDETTSLWTLGTLGAPGLAGEPQTAASLTIVARLTRPGAWENRAMLVERDLPDLNPLNDQGAVTVGIANDADLAVAKIVNVATAPTGGTAIFTVTLANAGPAEATSLVLADTLSPGLTLVSATATTGSFDSATRRWTLPALPAGAAAVLTVTATATTSGSHSNTIAVVTSDQPDPDRSNNTAGAAINVPAAVDLQIAKTAERVAAPVGAAVGFNIRVRNAGPDAASNVVVSEVLPESLRFVLATPSSGTFDPATGIWTIGTLAAGADATLRVVALVNTLKPSTNTASVSSAQIDVAPGNNTSIAQINASSLDLAVAIAAVGPQPLLGDLAMVRATLANLGPLAASGVEVRALLGAGLQFVQALPSQGTFDAQTGRWMVGFMAPTGAGPLTLDLVVRLHQPAQTIVAEVVRADQVDVVSSNDRAEIVLLGNAWSTFFTDLEIAATSIPALATPDAQLTFVASSTNNGPTLAEDVVITAALPSGLGFASVTPSEGGVCAAPPSGVNGVVTCQWPGVTVLESDARRQLRLVATVGAAIGVGTELITHFETTSRTAEYYPPNNVQDIRVSVPDGAAADLAVSVSIGGAPAPLAEAVVTVGEAVAVRLFVTNTGSVPISGAVLVDWPDADSLQVLGATATQGSGTPSGTGGRWDVGPVAPGGTAAATLVLRLLTTEAVTIVASRIGAMPADVNADNDTAAALLDGTGGTSGGRWTSAGNIDGVGGAEIVVGSGMLETPMVRVYNGSGLDTGLFFYAFDRRFRGGVRVAACDIDGDGRDEIIAAAGPGGGPHLRVLRVRGNEIAEIVGFYAFERDFGGGVHLACIDVNADGVEEVVASAGAGRPPEVRVFSLGARRVDLVTSWLAYESTFAGGVRVADASSAAGSPFNLLTTPGPGRAAELRGWRVGAGQASFLGQLDTGFSTIGTRAGVADLDGNGELELLVTPDPGVPAVIRVFSALTGESFGDARFYSPTFPGGVRFSIGVLDGGPGRPEVITSQGPGGSPRIETYYIGAAGVPAKRLDFVAIEIP